MKILNKLTLSNLKLNKKRTMVTIIGTIFTPILLHNIESFHFEIMPPLYYLIVAGLTILYVILVQIVKKIYIKKVGNWL